MTMATYGYLDTECLNSGSWEYGEDPEAVWGKLRLSIDVTE